MYINTKPEVYKLCPFVGCLCPCSSFKFYVCIAAAVNWDAIFPILQLYALSWMFLLFLYIMRLRVIYGQCRTESAAWIIGWSTRACQLPVLTERYKSLVPPLPTLPPYRIENSLADWKTRSNKISIVAVFVGAAVARPALVDGLLEQHWPWRWCWAARWYRPGPCVQNTFFASRSI